MSLQAVSEFLRMIQIIRFSEMNPNLHSALLGQLRRLYKEASPSLRWSIDDHRERVRTNADGYHLAMDGGQVVGASYTLRTCAIPTDEELNRAATTTSAALQHPDGTIFYFDLLLVHPDRQGKG